MCGQILVLLYRICYYLVCYVVYILTRTFEGTLSKYSIKLVMENGTSGKYRCLD
jgi:hypothetical protein